MKFKVDDVIIHVFFWEKMKFWKVTKIKEQSIIAQETDSNKWTEIPKSVINRYILVSEMKKIYPERFL